jgi:Amt family ammonium transporter
VGGTWGALATGLFASRAINDAGGNGLFFGNPGQLLVQALSVLVTMVFAFVGSLLLLKIVDAVIGLRVHEEDEVLGLDLSQHDENAYSLGLVGSAGSAGGSGFFGHRPPSTH